MQESERIADLSRRVMAGDPWHAGNVADLLADVSAREAAARPVPGVHSIWEIVLHLTGWVDEVRERVDGKPAGTPAVGDWPAIGRPTAARWTTVRRDLRAAYRRLEATIAQVNNRELVKPVTDFRSRKDGTGLSRYLTVHGVIHHAAYHAGQIAMLKRALRGARG